MSMFDLINFSEEKEEASESAAGWGNGDDGGAAPMSIDEGDGDGDGGEDADEKDPEHSDWNPEVQQGPKHRVNGLPLNGRSPFGMLRSSTEYTDELATNEAWMRDRQGTAGLQSPMLQAFRSFFLSPPPKGIPPHAKVIMYSHFVKALELVRDLLLSIGVMCEVYAGHLDPK